MINVSKNFRLEEVICFVDVSQAERHNHDPLVSTVWRQQIKSASIIVLNRFEDKQILPAVLSSLIDSSKPKIHFDKAKVPTTKQFHIKPTRSMRVQASGWESFVFETNEAVSLNTLLKTIEDWSGTLYRTKGTILDSDSGKAYILHYTGGQCRITPASDAINATQLVFIGAGKDAMEALCKHLLKYLLVSDATI